jgi:hypothetical protein
MCSGVFGSGFQKRRLVYPIALFHHLFGKAEGVEHFHRPAGNPVSLPLLYRSGFAFDHPRSDFREGGKLGGERQASGAAADDQHVKRFGKVRVRQRPAGCCIRDFRITGAETIQMILHCHPPCSSLTSGYPGFLGWPCPHVGLR